MSHNTGTASTPQQAATTGLQTPSAPYQHSGAACVRVLQRCDHRLSPAALRHGSQSPRLARAVISAQVQGSVARSTATAQHQNFAPYRQTSFSGKSQATCMQLGPDGWLARPAHPAFRSRVRDTAMQCTECTLLSYTGRLLRKLKNEQAPWLHNGARKVLTRKRMPVDSPEAAHWPAGPSSRRASAILICTCSNCKYSRDRADGVRWHLSRQDNLPQLS